MKLHNTCSNRESIFPVVNDLNGSIARAWGVHAVPASFIIGTDGQIRFVEVGYTAELGFRLRRWLARAGI